MRRLDLIGVVLNGVIGAGIFGLPSKVFGLAGTYSVVAFLVCAVCVGAIVLCFAEVASRFSGTGGPYLYARETYGRSVGFTVGWLVLIARITSFAANLSLLPAYLSFFIPAAGAGVVRAAILSAAVVLLTAVNVGGVRLVAGTSNIFAVGKLLPLAVFVTAGLFFLRPENFSFHSLPSYHGFSASVLLLVYAFTGFEMAVIPAGEARNPGRDLPVALICGMVLVIIFYVAIQVVCIGTLPGLAASQRPLADAAAGFLGTWGAVMLTAGIVVSLAGNLNVLVLTASRMVFAMAEAGDLPAGLAKIHPRFRTPATAVFVTSGILLGLTLSGTFIYMVTVSTLSRLGAYLATCGALPLLRRRPTAPKAAVQIPGGPVIAVVAVILGIWLLSSSTLKEARDTLLATAAGLAIYVFESRRRVAPR
jgi:amino acid transporter